jgi:hypothetical protein
MLTRRLLELIETHADALTQEVLKDLATNHRTPGFGLVPRNEMEARIFAAYHNLGKWISDRSDDAVRTEYESWGATRHRQGIPLSEIVYAVVIVKHHLRRFVRDHGLVEFSGDRVIPGDLIGVQLYSLQELAETVDVFFDRAIYYLARGYEREASGATRPPRAAASPGR